MLPRAAAGAKRAEYFTMHVNEVLRTGHLVQRIDILRDDEHIATMHRLQPRERQMRGIRFHILVLPPPLIIEVEHKRWVAAISLWRRHLANVIFGPNAILVAEGV